MTLPARRTKAATSGGTAHPSKRRPSSRGPPPAAVPISSSVWVCRRGRQGCSPSVGEVRQTVWTRLSTVRTREARQVAIDAHPPN
jgi:hypothetical protein